MSSFYVQGGKKLYGSVNIGASKNATLAILCASVLNGGTTFIKDCPKISDVETLLEILQNLGAEIVRKNSGVLINTTSISKTRLPKLLTSKIRASFFLVGSMLSKFHKVSICRPGGCQIGSRPIDIHLDGLKSLGVKIGETEEDISFSAENLSGGEYRFRFPSVGATVNLILVSVLNKGVTVLKNCAKEPEIIDLQRYLRALGAKIKGAGSSVITVEGVEFLKADVEFRPIPDRIETGTFLIGVKGVGGEVEIKGCLAKNILPLIKKISDNACKINVDNVNIYSDNIYINSTGNVSSLGRVKTAPYPYFPTDLQPQIGALAAKADGCTQIIERVFDSRFAYLEQLKKMGAKVSVKNDCALIFGSKLKGSLVRAMDLRGGAGLLLAGLFAEGETQICGVEHIVRGYEKIHEKLKAIGAEISLKEENED